MSERGQGAPKSQSCERVRACVSSCGGVNSDPSPRVRLLSFIVQDKKALHWEKKGVGGSGHNW